MLAGKLQSHLHQLLTPFTPHTEPLAAAALGHDVLAHHV